MRLQDKVILITGSTTGIGKAIALRCVREGARVVLHGLEVDLAEEVLSALPPGSAVAHVEDLSAEGCPQRLVDLALRTFGRLDGLVNNAALIGTGDVRTSDAALFQRMFQVNTVAPFLLIQAALPHLAAARGAVLNIGSVNAYAGEPNLLPYSVSKGALTTLTRNLGDALHRLHGVRVNQLNPGWVLTENETRRKRAHGLRDDWYADLPRAYAPSGRLLSPDEIAASAIPWLSDELGPVSGSVVELEQYPIIGRNPPKDPESLPGARA